MKSLSVVARVQETLTFLKSMTGIKPKIGIVLGSGLGEFARQIEVSISIPFKDIPNFLPPTVEGHSGNLIIGKIGDRSVVALQGRNHFYEGHSMDMVVFPVRVLALLGIEILILTNSAGGLGDGMNAGDFMVIDDHINLMGANPLMGPNIKEFGPRFPDMTEAYDKKLSQKMVELLTEMKISHHRGVYGGLSGPTYETPSEVRYLKMIGCHAVGMSTVPENIAANHLGVRVCALSCITNLAAGISKNKLSHSEVTETAKRVEKDFATFLNRFIQQV